MYQILTATIKVNRVDFKKRHYTRVLICSCCFYSTNGISSKNMPEKYKLVGFRSEERNF